MSGTVDSTITRVTVNAINASYTGPFDFHSFQHMENTGALKKYHVGTGGDINIHDGKWSTLVQFYDAIPSPGAYTIFLYDQSPPYVPVLMCALVYTHLLGQPQ